MGECAMSSDDPSKGAAEWPAKAAEYHEQADAAPPKDHEIYLYFRKRFLKLAEALDQEAKLRAYGSGTRH
jgi:hypothetical protein